MSLVFLAAVIVTMAVNVNMAPARGNGNTCTRRQCEKLAKYMHEVMDESVPPCEDFYHFACGNYKDKYPIPNGRAKYSPAHLIYDNNAKVIKEILEAEITEYDERHPYTKKMKTLYRSCMNEDEVNKLGVKPIKALINDLGGCPLLSQNWNPQKYSLMDQLVKVNKNFMFPLLLAIPRTDQKNPTKNVLTMDQQPDFVLPGRQYYRNIDANQKYFTAYKQLVYRATKLIGLVDQSSAQRDIEDILQFEKDLANITDPKETRTTLNKYKPQTLQEFSDRYSVSNLNIVNFVKKSWIGIEYIRNDEIIINAAPQYFAKLKYLLEKTDERIISNYIVIKAVIKYLGALGKEFQDIAFEMQKIVNGIKTRTPRENVCIAIAGSGFSKAVSRAFIETQFPAGSKRAIENMINHLQSTFNKNLDDLDWMDDQTRRYAKVKNRAMARTVGYPENLKNDSYLTEYYQQAKIRKSHFFQNVISLNQLKMHHLMKHLRRPVERQRWELAAHEVNAGSVPSKNKIIFPAGILQPPLFNADYPKYINYGSMGLIVGHEITHEFDNTGRHFDKNGAVKNWWTKETSEKFHNKTKCIIDQYSKYGKAIEGRMVHVNGKLTQGESIADNGGLSMAYQAYKSLNVTEPGLPGMQYTNDQMFFIASAQFFCENTNDAEMKLMMLTNVHPPNIFRVVGAITNSKSFAKTFNCDEGTPMNPRDKCKVW